MPRLTFAPSLLLAAALVANAQEAAKEPAKEAPKPAAWNVNSPPGVAKTANIDVQTGTWMSVRFGRAHV